MEENNIFTKVRNSKKESWDLGMSLTAIKILSPKSKNDIWS